MSNNIRRIPSVISGSRSARRSSSADRKSTRLNSSHDQISYAVFCLKKKKNIHLPPVIVNGFFSQVVTWHRAQPRHHGSVQFGCPRELIFHHHHDHPSLLIELDPFVA